jgi:hypothetical protein
MSASTAGQHLLAGRTPVIVVYAATALGGTLSADDECLETASLR